MKILALIPISNAKSPARIYRGDGILERLDAEIDYFTQEHMAWDWSDWLKASKKYDWLYVMRSAHIEHLNPCSMAKTFGIKIWYDLDDDYLAIEPDNTAFSAFQRQETRTAWQWFIKNADLRTYSTKPLLDKFGNGYLCQNALDDKVFPMDIEYPNPKPGLFTWRGGGSHLKDLLEYAPTINQFMEENPQITMHMIGSIPPWFLSKNKNLKYTEYIPDYWFFMQNLRQIAPWGNIIPLSDCAFNRGKSNIAALESVYAGACPLVPNWEEWNLPGALKYDNHQQFIDGMRALSTMSPEEHKQRWEANMKWIKENRSLSVVNKKRMELLCQ